MNRCLTLSLCFAFLCAAALGATPQVTESARKVPVAYQVDVVVVGGSTGAVAAAAEAAKGGAKVFLAAPRPYLGEDVAGTLRLWLEEGETPASPLAKAIFSGRAQPTADLGNTLPFTYEADLPSMAQHEDTRPPSLLSDGQWSSAAAESVQYDGDPTITADLGKKLRVEKAHAMVYHNKDYLFDSVAIATSDDKQAWKEAAALKNDRPATGDDMGAALLMSAPVGAEARYVRFVVKRREGLKRILVGEIAIVGAEKPKEERPPKGGTTNMPPATPLHVKRTLDQALLDAKVEFLYSCFPTDVLTDAEGRPCGIVMANRAGRQAVVAKVVIDATERATVARMTAAKFHPFPGGAQTVKRVVIGGKPQPSQGIVASRIVGSFAAPGRTGAQAYPIIDYTLKVPMADASYAAYAAADQVARDLTFDAAQQFTSDILFHVPPDPVVGQGGSELDACRPAGVERLYILGGCSDVPREQAEKLMRPIALIDLGTRIGAAAAAEAKKLPEPKEPKVAGSRATSAAKGDVMEILAGVREFQKLPTIPQEERPLPVLGSYDVVVIGGGTGGAPAGIAAARQGAKTLVVEHLHGLGGVGTLGAISTYYWGNRVGFCKTILDGKARWGIEEKAEWWRAELREARADIWFGSVGCGALVEDKRVRGAIVATPYGRGVVLAKTVIDATGNSDIAAAAGARCIYTDESDIALQGTGLPPRNLGASYTNTDYTITDETDMMDVWHLYLYAKRMAGNAFDLGQLIDTRERRRIVGGHTITILDQVLGRTHPDTVVQARSDFDTHGYTMDPYFTLQHPHGGKGFITNIPYRAMLPEGLDGILVIGLGISAHRDAVPLIRMQPDIENGGYAAGSAAAMAAKAGASVRKVDFKKLQEHLVGIGNLTQGVLTDKDSFPLPPEKIKEAVYNVRDNYKDVAVVLAHAKEATPLVRQAYAECPPESKLIYAHVLGVLGDPAGAPDLLKAIESAPDMGKGWHYKGMGQFGRNMSDVDTYIYALGRARDKRAIEAAAKKMKALEAKDAFSHFRAIALALEQLRDPAAAGPLAELLAKPGIRGHAIATPEGALQRADKHRSWTATEPRSNALRELMLARALFRCGDKEGLGKQVLEEYTKDYHGHFARHAAAVLKAGQ
ncbi:MAG: FAD-dependent oxidoreductase [Planctomycetes bacterium]|nr:FAD-dependent oxidoreductase [Planctomycetota bacterium]